MTNTYPTIIDNFCRFEESQPNQLFLSEPVKGIYQNFTWAKAGKEIKSMAAWLQQ